MKRAGSQVCQALIWWGSLLAAGHALAGEDCRIAFDMGSSGIRAGASHSQSIARRDFDYLGEWSAKRSLLGAEDKTLATLQELPGRAGFSPDCPRLGGGFSAWRLAAEANPHELADMLARLHKASGVAVLVIPQNTEGSYGYIGSMQRLGPALTTSHVLDIGGGSLQVSGAKASYGDALGQKIWYQTLCQAIRQTGASACTLQPMSDSELAAARTLLDARLQPMRERIGAEASLTAISRPVSQAVLPALKKLALAHTSAQAFSLAALTQGIEQLATMTVDETRQAMSSPADFARFLISDMLLVEGIVRATGGNAVQVAEVQLTNIPGLLADDKAFAWGQRYACYLQRLRHQGVSAFDGQPDCAEAPRD